MVAIEGRGREGSQVEWAGCEATQKIERGLWCIPQSWEGHLWDSLILSSNTYIRLPLLSNYCGQAQKESMSSFSSSRPQRGRCIPRF